MISLVLVFSIFLPSYPLIGYAEPNPNEEIKTELDNIETFIRPDHDIPPEINLEDSTELEPDEQTDSGSFELIIDESVPNEYRDKLQQEFQRVYPLLVKQWNTNAPKRVHLKNGKLEKGILGRAEDNEVTLDFQKEENLNLLKQENYWVFIHELAHVTTWHFAGAPWLLEGIADYSVVLFGKQYFQPRQFQPPSPNDTVETLKERKYEVAARFLLWLKDNQKSTIIEDLNKAGFEITEKVLEEFNGVVNEENLDQYIMRYEQELDVKLKELTGKTLEELWADYVRNPGNYEESFNCLTGNSECTKVSNPEKVTQTSDNGDNQQFDHQQVYIQHVDNQQSDNQRSNEVERVNQNNVTKIPSSLILKMLFGEQ